MPNPLTSSPNDDNFEYVRGNSKAELTGDLGLKDLSSDSKESALESFIQSPLDHVKDKKQEKKELLFGANSPVLLLQECLQ